MLVSSQADNRHREAGAFAPHPAAGLESNAFSRSERARVHPTARGGASWPNGGRFPSAVFRGGRPREPRKGGAAIAVDDARVNEQIRSREVRLIAENGDQLGVRATPEALEYARGKELDLVEVAPNAQPPVCRVMDFGKYRYEQDQRRKEARKKQRQSAGQTSIKEMKFRPKIDAHDYATKVRHVERFLKEGSKVKLTIMFRGREVSHPELGKRILDRVAEEVGDFAEVEHYPRIDGRNMTMVLAPMKEGRRRRRQSEELGQAPSETQAPLEAEPEAQAAAVVASESETPEVANEAAAADDAAMVDETAS